jgi:hypothetical protein
VPRYKTAANAGVILKSMDRTMKQIFILCIFFLLLSKNSIASDNNVPRQLDEESVKRIQMEIEEKNLIINELKQKIRYGKLNSKLKDESISSHFKRRGDSLFFSQAGYAKNLDGEGFITVQGGRHGNIGFPNCIYIDIPNEDNFLSIFSSADVQLIDENGGTKKARILSCVDTSNLEGDYHLLPAYWTDHKVNNNEQYKYILAGKIEIISPSELIPVTRNDTAQNLVKDATLLKVLPEDGYYDNNYYYLATHENEELILFNIYCHSESTDSDYGYYEVCSKDDEVKRAGSYMYLKDKQVIVDLVKGLPIEIEISLKINKGYLIFGDIQNGKSASISKALTIQNKLVNTVYSYKNEGS